MSAAKEIETLFNEQNQLMTNMNRLYENYKKDGPGRRTVSNITNKLNALDGFWEEFLNNHRKLEQLKVKDYSYFAENCYEKTKSFYESTRAILTNQLEVAKHGLPSPKPSERVPQLKFSDQLTSWVTETEENNQEETNLVTSPDQHPNDIAGPSHVNYQQSERDSQRNPQHNQETAFKQPPINTRFAIPPISHNIDKSKIDSEKLAEKMRKQQSNFKAFARTIFYIDLSIINEKWELEDLLKTVQSRWATIDSLHWDIDSELFEDDEIYSQAFCKYERKFQEIKKLINTKIWAMSHREKSAPMMDIPPFSGNYQQWLSFKDLFNEAIHFNRSMSNAQKMQFLKNKVRGEAEKLIQHLNISSENYLTCWEILNHRYNNTKLIFTAHLNTLLSIPSMQQQSYPQIKRLHDTTNECLNAISNLGVDIKSWDPLIVHILSQKLDAESHTEYVESLKNPRDLPKLKEFLDFLEMKFTSYEASRRKIDTPKQAIHHETSRKPHYKSFGSIKDSSLLLNKSTDFKSSYQQRKTCPVCNQNHGIFHCETFQRAKAENKRNIISKLNLCKNCLYNHYDKDCFSSSRCRTCHEMHNTLVHDAYTLQPDTNESPSKRKNVANVTQQQNNTIEILLATALIKVKAADGNHYTMRALIDQGSQMSLISENAAQLLQLPRQRCKGTIYGIGANENICKGVIRVTASSLLSEFQFGADLYIMKTLIHHLPNRSFSKPTWSYLKGVPLADPEFNVSRPIDLLLGADVYATIIQGGVIKESESLPVAQQTRLGWILCGNVPSHQCNIVVNNMDDIMRFWAIEDITESSSSSNLSSEDQYCLKYYQDTTSRRKDGRYVVRLPLKHDKENSLGNSKNMAIAQFKQLEKKFQRHQNIRDDYKTFVNEYIDLGHMRLCSSDTSDQCNSTPDCYLPHHCVQRAESTTTKLRVVFNASAKTSNGLSLNDIMYSGPNLQHDLLSLIIKWRQYEIAFTADIEKMFRQIFVDYQDQKYQKIIWRDHPHQQLREYALSTVTYGTKAAPFLAMMTLRQLARDERHNYPDAARVVEDNFYMDDLLHGCHTIKTAKKLQSDLIALMKSGGFNLRKWASNRPQLLEGVSKAEDLQQTFEFKDQETTKTLGLRWHPREDHFTFQMKLEPSSTNTSKTMTKRALLSNIAKVFDPLGWLSPVTTKLKLLFQNVVSNDVGWNDQISDEIKKEWDIISQDLQNIKEIKMPRWLNSRNNQNVELHGFSDASTKSYACVIYCRVINHNDDGPAPPPVLVAAKSRLVPTKKDVSLPRLELCAALLLSTLMIKVKESLSNLNIKVFGWSDSTAVLGWLNGEPSKWKPFISNRVAKIIEVIPSASWNYVKSGENPADCASRGITAQKLLQHQLWWNGPIWLPSYNPNQEKPTFTTDQEIKTSKQCHTSICKQTNDVINDLINKLLVLPVSENEPSNNEQQNNSKVTVKEDRSLPKTTRSRTIASNNKFINFITMILMLFALSLSPAHCTYNISSFEDGQGIYFDKITNMKMARDEWKLVVYYNIDPYWQGRELLSKYINHLENNCYNIETQSQCKIILLQLRHAFSELNYYDSLLLGQRSALSRSRRGLINGIGNIAHSLFGVLDEQFAEQYQKDIELTRTNEKHLANLWKNQTSIIEAEYNLLKRVENTVQEQYKTFSNHLYKLESTSNQLKNQIEEAARINEFAISSIIANSILVNLKNIQDTLLETITNVIYGKFNIHLLTPQQLQDELNIIAGQVSNDLTLPCENINTDLPKLYQLMRVRTRMTHQFLIFEIKIPLVHRDVYELFRLIPIPQQTETNMIKIKPIANQVAINIQKELFIPMLDEVIKKCEHYDIQTLICTLQGPIYQLKSDKRLCVMDQVTKHCKTETDTCRSTWSELSAINMYLFFCCDQCTARIICGQEVKAEHLRKAGIIALQKDCVINGDTFTIFSHKRPSSEMKTQSDVVQFEIPSINHAINLTIPVVSHSWESSDHESNQRHLKVIRDQIEQMKTECALSDQINYHDIHHYTAIYVVMAIVVVIAALYMRRFFWRRRLVARLTPPSFAYTPAGRGCGAVSMSATQRNSLPSAAENNGSQHTERPDLRADANGLHSTITPPVFRGFTSIN